MSLPFGSVRKFGWPPAVVAAMEVDEERGEHVLTSVDDADLEAEEDILMLKAHMGHFDHMLQEGPNAVHLIDRQERMPSSPMVKDGVSAMSTPVRRVEVVEFDNSSDEETFSKGDSRKKRRASSVVVIDLEGEDSNDEEDLDVMKMKKYPETQQMGPPIEPAPKRRQIEEIAPHYHQPLSASAPTTPVGDTFKRAMLANTGRYYDDSALNTQVKTCRFCAKTYGVPYRPPSNRMTCFICGGGHIARECPNILCYNCWELGHRSGSCKNPRMPKTSCFRCGGHHDALDCLPLRGVQRLGANKSKKASSKTSQGTIPLPLLCCNCGQTGHVSRDCRTLSMDDTTREAERDPQAWYQRRKYEIERESRQSSSQPQSQHRSRSHSHTGNYQPPRNNGNNSSTPQQRTIVVNRDSSHSTPHRSKSPSHGGHQSFDSSRSDNKKSYDRRTPRSESYEKRAPSSESRNDNRRTPPNSHGKSRR